ncbi:MAG: toll/interleukin-1 receptor domain-containing protein [bacterium]
MIIANFKDHKSTKQIHPKVFICHASEDKDFAIDLATKLRTKGIDAWIDKWEILPGDNLVDKIFNEGISKAQAIIVILSQISIQKRWVKAEQDTAVIKKITEDIKLIPIVIEDCKIPVSLICTYRISIKDKNSYDNQLEEIINAIYERYTAPPLGNPPAYTQISIESIDNLTETDSLILKLFYDKAIETDEIGIIANDFFKCISIYNIPEMVFYDSLDVLSNAQYIEARQTQENGRITAFRITYFGFEKYAHIYVSQYNLIIKTIIDQIINYNKKYSIDISNELKLPLLLVNHVFERLASDNYINITDAGTYRCIIKVSPIIKRQIDKI